MRNIFSLDLTAECLISTQGKSTTISVRSRIHVYKYMFEKLKANLVFKVPLSLI